MENHTGLGSIAKMIPFTVAGIYEHVTVNDEPVICMSMLTINANDHPFINQFHAPDDGKRSIVVFQKASVMTG